MVFHAPKHEFRTQTSHFAVKLISNSYYLIWAEFYHVRGAINQPN